MGSLREYLGRGYTFEVYAYEEDRVIKIPRPAWKAYLSHGLSRMVSQRRPVLPHNPFNNAYQSLLGLYLRNLERPDLFGYPEPFPEELYYTQQRITPSEEILNNKPEKGFSLVDSYVGLIPLLWEEGIGEQTWNWTINTGVADDGTFILADLDELTFSYETVRDEVVSRKWSRQMSAKHGLASLPEVRQYYHRRMDEIITMETLRKHWSSS
jgi:hypothetical protein